MDTLHAAHVMDMRSVDQIYLFLYLAHIKLKFALHVCLFSLHHLLQFILHLGEAKCDATLMLSVELLNNGVDLRLKTLLTVILYTTHPSFLTLTHISWQNPKLFGLAWVLLYQHLEYFFLNVSEIHLEIVLVSLRAAIFAHQFLLFHFDLAKLLKDD